MVCCLALLASGQAMAAYFGNAATINSFTDGTKWRDGDSGGSCTGGSAGTGTITVAASDSFFLCTGKTFALTANTTFDGASVWASDGGGNGTLDIGNFTLTMSNPSGAIVTNFAAGTITFGSGGIVFSGASSTLFNSTTGTFTAGTGTVTFNGTGAEIAGTLTLNNIVAAGTLNIPATATINGDVTIGGNVTGGLKLSAANHGITATAAATIPTIDASAMTVGQTITFNPAAGQAITVSAFTAPTTPGTGIILTCNGTASGAIPSPFVAQTGNYICTGAAGGGTVSAPIFDLKPAQVFATEVEK